MKNILTVLVLITLVVGVIAANVTGVIAGTVQREVVVKGGQNPPIVWVKLSADDTKKIGSGSIILRTYYSQKIAGEVTDVVVKKLGIWMLDVLGKIDPRLLNAGFATKILLRAHFTYAFYTNGASCINSGYSGLGMQGFNRKWDIFCW